MTVTTTHDGTSLLIRAPKPSDQAYVAATWCDSMMAADRANVRSEVNRAIDRLLDDKHVSVAIGGEPTRPDLILGWICYSKMGSRSVLHYVYTREKMRRRGIADLLYAYADRPIVYTMSGPMADTLLKSHPKAIHLSLTDYLAA